MTRRGRRRARCHPSRLAANDRGLCQVCVDRADNVILRREARPARILGVAQHGSETLPPSCPKCHTPKADDDRDTFHCWACGLYWERTVGVGGPPVRHPLTVRHGSPHDVE